MLSPGMLAVAVPMGSDAGSGLGTGWASGTSLATALMASMLMDASSRQHVGTGVAYSPMRNVLPSSAPGALGKVLPVPKPQPCELLVTARVALPKAHPWTGRSFGQVAALGQSCPRQFSSIVALRFGAEPSVTASDERSVKARCKRIRCGNEGGIVQAPNRHSPRGGQTHPP